ncbi:diguanylate cyclase domain-containing protein [Aliidiomarina sp. Khilg15.8]
MKTTFVAISCAFLLCIAHIGAVAADQKASIYVDEQLEIRLDSVLEVGLQPSKREEFHAILKDINGDTPIDTQVRARAYHAFETAMGDNDMDAAMAEVQELLELTAQTDSVNARLEALAAEAELLLRAGETAEAMARIPALEDLTENATNARVLFFTYHLIGRILTQNSQYEEALANFIKSHDIIAATDDRNTQRRRIYINLHIARLHADLRNNEAALTLTNRTIEDALEHELHGRLPDLYVLQGFINGRDGPSDDVLQSYMRAIDWAERVGDDRVRLVGRNNAGSVLIMLERYEEASGILGEGERLARDLGMRQEQALMQFNQGYIAVLQGRYEEGLSTIEEAAAQYREYARMAEIADMLEYQASAYAIAGNHKQQAEALLEQRKLRDEVFRSERDRVISDLQVRYEAQEQSRQIELLEQRNQLQQATIANNQLEQRIVVLVVAVIILVALLLFFAYRNAKKTNQRLNEANEQLHDQSIRDPLTGLLNRRSLQQEMAARTRLPAEKDALFLIDIDLFKQINDTEGHAAGDEVLKVVSERLQHMCRDSDLVVRWGGEEFLIYLRTVSVDALPDFARRLLQVISGNPIRIGDHKISVSATGGFVTLPFEGIEEEHFGWEKALQIADMLLYVGKSQGRNQINGVVGLNAVYDDHVKKALDRDIAKAIKNGWVDTIYIQGPDQE